MISNFLNFFISILRVSFTNQLWLLSLACIVIVGCISLFKKMGGR